MNPRRWLLLAGFALLAMAAVWWFGQQYGDEARAFLRGLRRIV
ncbi:hypothetical protein RDV84_04190 [Lysobacter yananisis]|uniref:Uncharacterized protein n=1 Tax=Lysobacter yananisis TaxID=1003114 RepID=A0ABY9PCG4_9GAMM|nr:hypothetical protein [Lysobacter yananisis]WMT04059.1 hypothetical protein RDV84_04190 [Lysobacter yananisis]